MFKKRRRKIFVNKTKKGEREAIINSLKRIMGTAYYTAGPIKL